MDDVEAGLHGVKAAQQQGSSRLPAAEHREELEACACHGVRMHMSSQAGSYHFEHAEIDEIVRRLGLGREHGGTLDDGPEESACTH